MSLIQPHNEFLELCAVSTSGQLSEEEPKRLQEHLAVCESCPETLKQYETVVKLAISALVANEADVDVGAGPDWSEDQQRHAEQASFEPLERTARDEPRNSASTNEGFTNPHRLPPFFSESAWRHMWMLYAGIYGGLQVLVGKTKAARRAIPLTQRVHSVLEIQWQKAGKPDEGFVFPAPTKQGHAWHDSIRVQHKKALDASKVRPFVVYALRHTFLTRLGESGCDVWTLARIAGHSSIKMTERYVHSGREAALNAMSRLPLPISE